MILKGHCGCLKNRQCGKFYEKRGKKMKPQSTQRETLCSQKEFPLKDITGQIISCAIEVHSTLGPGLLEGVYEEALEEEFGLRGILYERQKDIGLKYKGKVIGKHRIDYLVAGEIIVELKAVEAMHKIYEAQVLTYLRASGKKVGLLINFNVTRLREGIKRLIV
jgi:GxxExxY protein